MAALVAGKALAASSTATSRSVGSIASTSSSSAFSGHTTRAILSSARPSLRSASRSNLEVSAVSFIRDIFTMGAKGSKGAKKEVSSSGYKLSMSKQEIDEEAKKLTSFQRNVCFNEGTERAFTGKTINGYAHDNKERGMYVTAVGSLPLFSSETKFDSGTGWPSFYAPVDPDHVLEIVDKSIPFMPRTEVVCAKSGVHLGHVFDDGPRPTGKRYCMNAAALKFIPEREYKEMGEKK